MNIVNKIYYYVFIVYTVYNIMYIYYILSHVEVSIHFCINLYLFIF